MSLDSNCKTLIVWLILNGRAEEALEQLAKQYNVAFPKLKVGLPKRHRRNTLGCYTPENQTIYVLNSDVLNEPYVIIHEFYHHLRTSVDKKHRGTEKYANEFAKEFLNAHDP